jgi:hypothetical protein
MKISDLDLFMKFQRQPRIIGTECYYAPTNKLLIPPGIKRGDHVFICDAVESGDDVYVTVAPYKWHFLGRNYPNEQELRAKINSIPENLRVKVIWKDLAV